VRVDTGGGVRHFGVPGSAPADGGIVTASDGTLWYSSAGERFGSRGSAVGRLSPGSGRVDTFGLVGRPLDIVKGPGNSTVWVTTITDSGRANWVQRIATQAWNSPRRPSYFRCAGQQPAACRDILSRVPLGDRRLFDAHGRVGGITVGPDGNVWYTEGSRIGRVLVFRGTLPCYEPVSRPHNFGCGHVRSHDASVTHSGMAYLRSTCPYLTFRVCYGTVTMRSDRGRFLSNAPFLLVAYDNPRIRVPLPRSINNQVKRGKPVRVYVTYDSQDQGGVHRTTTGWFSLRLTG